MKKDPNHWMLSFVKRRALDGIEFRFRQHRPRGQLAEIEVAISNEDAGALLRSLALLLGDPKFPKTSSSSSSEVN